MPTSQQLCRTIRIWLLTFIAGLVLSGVTAFPLVHETTWLVHIADALHLHQHTPGLFSWLCTINDALTDTAARYPFLAYGTDWLAFGHLVIAAVFIPVYRDPLRNRAIIDIGLVACLGVPFLAFLAGPVRHIPFFWRCIDSSFGLFGAIPLLLIRNKIDSLEHLTNLAGVSLES